MSRVAVALPVAPQVLEDRVHPPARESCGPRGSRRPPRHLLRRGRAHDPARPLDAHPRRGRAVRAALGVGLWRPARVLPVPPALPHARRVLHRRLRPLARRRRLRRRRRRARAAPRPSSGSNSAANLFSSHTCIGDMSTVKPRAQRACLFERICLDGCMLFCEFVPRPSSAGERLGAKIFANSTKCTK